MSEGQSGAILAGAILTQLEQAALRLERVRAAVAAIIIGQDKVIERTLVTVLAGGHGLLVGLPGLAKTKLVETLGVVLGLDTRRVQFTPDLMPADILGSEVLEESAQGAKSFRFLPGPVFSQLLMADEINRASPRTQSALLQAMQEQHVSIAGVRHDLPQPFNVLATQNPLEQEGTYPLPEAQLDRFLCQIDVTYPDRAAERRIVIETTGLGQPQPQQVLTAQELIAFQQLVRQVPVGERIVEAVLDLVRTARPGEGDANLAAQLSWSPGPRAAQALILAVRARALLQGRLSPSLEDVAELAEPVLKHRMALTFAARAAGASVEGVIAELVKKAVG
jgi:MoxR-like ATPase